MIKSHLFSITYESEERLHDDDFKIEMKWGNVMDSMGNAQNKMLRYYAIVLHGPMSKNDVVKDIITSTLIDGNSVQKFIHIMEKTAELYRMVYIDEDGGDCWLKDNLTKMIFRKLKKPGKYEMYFPVILASYLICNDELDEMIVAGSEKKVIDKKIEQFSNSMQSLAKAIETHYVRNLMVTNKKTNTFETDYDRYAECIYNKSLSMNDVVKEIYSNCDSDALFTTGLKRNGWTNPNAYYLLARIAFDAKGGTNELPKVLDVEHILPQNNNFTTFSIEWPGITLAMKNENQYKIGNMILLKNHQNKKAGCHNFILKKTIYKAKGIDYVFDFNDKTVMDSETWDAQAIDARTNAIIEKALTVWGIQC